MAEIKYICENGVLTLSLEGRIDSVSAPLIGGEIDNILSENAYDAVVIDADKLEYISSAGLRVVLKLRRAEPTLKIVNANIEVYDIFDMTGFCEMMPVEKAYRKLSVDGCPVIGRGAKGTVYRYNGDTVVKVYNDSGSLSDIIKERVLARRAFVLGIPTAISYDIVKVGEKYGSVFELLDANSYSKLISEDMEHIDGYIADFASTLRLIHSTPVTSSDIPNIKDYILDGLELTRGCLGDAAYEKLKRLIIDVPSPKTMLHCDYHTNNVMRQNGETMLIDMDRISHGHPVFELANIHMTYVVFGENDPAVVENFLGIPYDTAKYIWKKFLECYLGTTNEARLADVERKTCVLSYLRLIRRSVKGRSDDNMVLANYGASKIRELLCDVDTLDF